MLAARISAAVGTGVGLVLALFGCAAAGPRPFVAADARARALLLNEQALALIESNALDQAQPLLRQAIQADPFCGQAHCNLGVLLLQQGQMRDAALHLQSACQLMPRASKPRANLGLLFELAGRYDRAEEQLRAALAIDADDVEVIGYLARLRVRQGRSDPETRQWLETLATAAEEPWRRWAVQRLRHGPKGHP